MAFSRDNLNDFLKKYFNLVVSKSILTEAIYACRGPKLDEADPKNFDRVKLADWLFMNLPSLVQMN